MNSEPLMKLKPRMHKEMKMKINLGNLKMVIKKRAKRRKRSTQRRKIRKRRHS